MGTALCSYALGDLPELIWKSCYIFVLIRHPNLQLHEGDACDVESFVSALEGSDAVMSGLGVFASIFNPTTFYSESMQAILEGMKRYSD